MTFKLRTPCILQCLCQYVEYFLKFFHFDNVLYGSVIFFFLCLSLSLFTAQFFTAPIFPVLRNDGENESSNEGIHSIALFTARIHRAMNSAEKQRDKERCFAVKLILSIRRPKRGKTIVKYTARSTAPLRNIFLFLCTNYLYSRLVFRSENRNNACQWLVGTEFTRAKVRNRG